MSSLLVGGICSRVKIYGKPLVPPVPPLAGNTMLQLYLQHVELSGLSCRPSRSFTSPPSLSQPNVLLFSPLSFPHTPSPSSSLMSVSAPFPTSASAPSPAPSHIPLPPLPASFTPTPGDLLLLARGMAGSREANTSFAYYNGALLGHMVSTAHELLDSCS